MAESMPLPPPVAKAPSAARAPERQAKSAPQRAGEVNNSAKVGPLAAQRIENNIPPADAAVAPGDRAKVVVEATSIVVQPPQEAGIAHTPTNPNKPTNTESAVSNDEDPPYDPNDKHLDRFNSPQNAQALEGVLSDPEVLRRPTRTHQIAVRDGKTYLVKDGDFDMADEDGNYKPVAPYRIGNKLLYTMFAGTTGYGPMDHLRHYNGPLAGEFVLLGGNGFLQLDPGGEGEKLIESWNGPTAKLAYAEQGKDGVIRLVDAQTNRVLIADAIRPPQGIDVSVVVGMGTIRSPHDDVVRNHGGNPAPATPPEAKSTALQRAESQAQAGEPLRQEEKQLQEELGIEDRVHLNIIQNFARAAKEDPAWAAREAHTNPYMRGVLRTVQEGKTEMRDVLLSAYKEMARVDMTTAEYAVSKYPLFKQAIEAVRSESPVTELALPPTGVELTGEEKKQQDALDAAKSTALIISSYMKATKEYPAWAQKEATSNPYMRGVMKSMRSGNESLLDAIHAALEELAAMSPEEAEELARTNPLMQFVLNERQRNSQSTTSHMAA
jgi:hypothetical protein